MTYTYTYETSGQAHAHQVEAWRAMDEAVEIAPSLHFVMTWATAAWWFGLLAAWMIWFDADFERMQVKLAVAAEEQRQRWPR